MNQTLLVLHWTLSKATLVCLLSSHSLLYYIVYFVGIRLVENGRLLLCLLTGLRLLWSLLAVLMVMMVSVWVTAVQRALWICHLSGILTHHLAIVLFQAMLVLFVVLV